MRLVVLLAASACLAGVADAFSVGGGMFARPTGVRSSLSARSSLKRGHRGSKGILGLRSQLGQMGSDGTDEAVPEISEELMLLLALDTQKKRVLPEGSKVVVFGALDRLGQVVVRSMVKDGRYKPVVQTYEGYEENMRWRIDGQEEPFVEEAQVVYNRIPSDVSAAVLCVEQATDVDKLKGVLSAGLQLRRFVLVSRGGIDLREDDWKLKFNPFLNLDKWNLLEETLKEYAETANWDYTIIRAGALKGGPFFNTNRQFDQALEDRIFDGEMEGAVLKAGDQDGDTGRDLLAQTIIETLARPETTNKMISVLSTKTFREDAVKCSDKNFLQCPSDRGTPRQCLTPNKEEWDKAFGMAFNKA